MSENIITKPLLALRGMMVFPGMISNLDIGREKSLNALEAAEDKLIILVTQKDPEITDVIVEDLYPFGVLAKIRQETKMPNGALRVLVEGLERVQITMVTNNTEPKCFFVGQGTIIDDTCEADSETEALRRLLLESFEQWMVQNKKVNPDALAGFKEQRDIGRLADSMVGFLSLPIAEKESLLEMANPKERLRTLYELLCREVEISGLAKNISQQVQEQIEQNQKEYYLREQIKAISKELGESEDLQSEVAAYREKIAALELPDDVRAKLHKELDRLLKMQPMAPEGAVVRSYVDALITLPWGKFTDDNYDLTKAQKILDHDHYGLKKVKERILEYLAVRSLAQTTKGPILCLVGPPGVGKTSLAQSVARSINRQFTRVSLGGVRDEAEIRGHRRTYVGAIPGRIIHGMQTCGCMNPVFLLDEIDKLASDFRGDPASALLEALDPEQNHAFCDHFIEFPFDLSHVFWIVTANTTETIPPALLDRMEVIQLSSYTEEEKLQISKLHLIPKEKKQNGLEKYKVSFSENAVRRIIRDYTREAGVRNLERKIGTVCRKIAYKIVKGESKSAQVTEKNLEKYLGPILFLEEDVNIDAAVGSCNGLAWTSVGGELLKVEVLTYKGKGQLTLTGQLGDVMKESAQAGFTFIRSRAKELGVPEDFAEKLDMHIHLPEGAIPKDGPSAGVTMITAMVSALSGRKVKEKLAMTGEITLSGRVLPVGGIKEKMLAAYRYGVKTIILPRRNMQDLEELPENVREEMTFHPVRHVDEVLELALEAKDE